MPNYFSTSKESLITITQVSRQRMAWLFPYSLVVEIIVVYDQVEDVLGEMGVEALTLQAIFQLHISKAGLLLIMLGQST